MILLACGLSSLPIAQSQEATTSAEIESVVESIRQAHDAARTSLRNLPGDRFETHPVLEANDYEVEAIVDWVARNTRWVPYRGVLRGAEGVLMDRTGNSLDRSLLLARLLEDAGYDARLVRGRLSSNAVDAVLAFTARPAETQPPSEQLFADQVMEAAARASGEAAALAEIVGPLPVRLDREIEDATADHWWIEVKLDDGWGAVDALLDGPLAPMRPEPLARLSQNALPDSLFHRVTVRVVIERWDGGETIEEIPLEHSFPVADATYRDFELQFVPYHFESAPDGSAAGVEAEAIAETAEEWLPVLRSGSEIVTQKGFSRSGSLNRDPARVAAVRKAEKAAGALQGLGSSGVVQPSHLTALWLEYQVDVPGRAPDTVRREIFDLIGASRRRSGAVGALVMGADQAHERGRSLLGVHRILVTNTDLPAIALEKASWEFWANHGPQLAALMRAMDGSEDVSVLQRAHSEPIVALDLLGLATARHLLSRHRSSIYLESPNIFSTHFTVDLGDNFTIRKAFDLVINRIGVVPRTTTAPERIRVEQGMLDTILEAAMLESNERSGNAADLFALRDAGVAWRRIDSDSVKVDMPASVRARIDHAIASGRIVVAPSGYSEDEEPAWWEIDPLTGTTLGIGSKGWGQVAENTVRGIGTTGFLHGARRYSINVSCKVVFAYLKTNGWIFHNLSGGLTYTVQAMSFLMARGCSVVI